MTTPDDDYERLVANNRDLVPELLGNTDREPTRLQQLRDALVRSEDLDGLPEPEPLIDGLIMKDSLAWIYGKPASFKSVLALDWASCVSIGLPWDMRGVQQVPVLYVIAEGTRGLKRRVRAWEEHSKTATRVTFLPVAVQVMDGMDFTAFQQIATDMHAGLVVIDTQARVTVGKDENSAVDMGMLVSQLDKLRRATHACVLTVHHEPRAGENMRGSTSMEGAAESLFRCVRDGSQLTVSCTKQKEDDEESEIKLWKQKILQSVILTSQAVTANHDQLSETDCQILTELETTFGSDSVSASTLLKVVKIPERSFYRSLGKLVDQGKVIKAGTDTRPRYSAA